MKNLKLQYTTPQMEMIGIDADLIRTSGPLSNGGEGAANSSYDITRYFNFS